MKLKIFLILLSTVFTSPVFAGAAERQESIYDAAMKSRNGIGVSNVRAANDMINADITQRVTVDGSNATINTKVSIPANDDSFKRNTAKHAKNLLKGGAAGAAAAAAMGLILDGVGWVIDEGGKVTRKPKPEDSPYNDPSKQYIYVLSYGSPYKYLSSVAEVCKQGQLRQNPDRTTFETCYVMGGTTGSIAGNNTGSNWGSVQSNPSYNPSAPKPPNVAVPDGEMEDAFYNWFKNNTHSLTDPVTTYIYSPKDSQGNALPKSPEGSDPSFGPNEITDEMMDNYMEHRDANLQNPYTTSIQDSTQTDTTQNPDGSTSTKTETSTQTKPKPETTDLPAFCDYAAALCTWMNRDTEHKADEKSLWQKITDWFDWTKEEPDHKDEDTKVDVSEMDIPDVKTNLFNASGQCPPDFSYPFPLPTGGTYNITYSYLGVCEWFGKLYYINVTCGWIAAYMIVVGRGEKKNG